MHCNDSVFHLFDMKFGLYRGLIVSLSRSPDHKGACETDGPCWLSSKLLKISSGIILFVRSSHVLCFAE